MRRNNIALNVSTAILYEIVAIISGLILPRLILLNFGSASNGIVVSITQFLGFVVLFRSGIGGVSKVYLYKTLNENDLEATSSVMHATNDYMKKVSIFFLLFLIALSIAYPFIVKEEWLSTFLLVLVCGLSSLADNYFGISAMILLQADRKEYIISISNIIVTALNVLFAYLLILLKCPLIVVKLGTAVAFCLKPIFLFFFVKKKYCLDSKMPYKKNLLSQKKDAFIHVLAEFVHRNTDIIVLTIFSGPIAVSIYGVHAVVTNGLRKLTNALTSNYEAVLGKEYCKENKDVFMSRFNRFKLLTILISLFVYLTCFCLFCSFINVYTKGVDDAEYVLPFFAALLCLSELIDFLNTPYQFAIRVAGKFKETKVISIVQAILNIVLSIILVNIVGIIGVAIGTVIAMLWRYVANFIYCKKNLIAVDIRHELRLAIAFVISIGVIIALFVFISPSYAETYLAWLLQAAIIVPSVFATLTLCFFAICFKDMYGLLQLFKSYIVRKRTKHGIERRN